jgi:nitroimidazol reductase NimA-like FMN-containing flavoprotein (pyridoxamine 5'-phosphate oxidase superfamily)
VSAASDLEARAKAILDASQYLTLATADASGLPWASPVWFASDGYREFLWISSPQARHSRNIAVRPEVAIVVFDSRQPPGTGAGVYVSATAGEVPAADLDRGVALYSRVSEERGAGPFGRADVEPPAKHRLYRATASEHFVLSATDERIPVQLG